MALHVTNSPFTEKQAEQLNRLLPGLTDYQRTWLSAYLTMLTFKGVQGSGSAGAWFGQDAGMEAAHAAAPAAYPAPAAPAAQAPVAAPAAPAAPDTSAAQAAPAAALPKEATVLFGSQSGNAQKLAKQLAQQLEGKGFKVLLSAMSDFKTNDLPKVRNLFIVVSTYGEGEPPDNALSFHEFLHSSRAPRLEGTNFAVLALGDTSYEHFCKTGKDFDERLEALGAKRLVPRADCDVDYQAAAAAWMKQVLAAVESVAGSSAGAAESDAGIAVVHAAPAAAATAPAAIAATTAADTAGEAEPAYSRSNPFYAEVLQNINLNGRGSDKETHHIEISLGGSGLTYEPGDALGVYPENHPRLVDEIIYVMGWNEKEPVPVPDRSEPVPLREALLRHYEITVLTRNFMEKAAQATDHPKLRELTRAENERELKTYTQGRDLLDLARDFELRGMPASRIVPLLRKIPPRLYSIASSQKAVPDEAHITVGAVRYHLHGRTRFGVASVHLAGRALPGKKLAVYVHHNPNFKLPQDPDAPIIMIGPGTGVAPFRGFLMEREETGAQGKTWLFFGDRHFRTDFLYQTEWLKWLKSGVLTRIDLAFSRDSDRKIYVQHRMAERSRELFQWLEEGACVYVCGDRANMAKDVHETLLAIIRREGRMTGERAAEYLARLQREKRYQRDVY